MTKVRVLLLFTTLIVVGVLGYFISLITRGYRFDLDTFRFSPNGILVAKSEPDGASIYVNGELRGATNSNIPLGPGIYDVTISLSGYTPWNKRLTIKKEEVTQITAQLFKTAPSLSPVTFDGATNPVISADYSKIAYINSEGLWVMDVSILPIGFSNDPKKITDGNLELSSYQFSPTGRELLLQTKTGYYLLDAENFTPQAQMVNITNQKDEILQKWNEQIKKTQESQFKQLPLEVADILKNKASSFTFSPDDNMVFYTASGSATIPENLIKQLPGSSTQKQEREIKTGNTYVYDIKEDRNFLVDDGSHTLYWLPTSRHLILPDEDQVFIMDYDGTNKQSVFSGNYMAPHAYPFVNSRELLILTNLGSNSAATNLYSLTIK